MKALAGQYGQARMAYENLARSALEDRLARGNARKLFFSALLAHIASMTTNTLMEDAGVLQQLFDTYQDLDTQFNVHTREHMVITALLDAIMSDNSDMYDDAIRQYDDICPLDKLRRAMLDKGRETLRAHASDLR